ncbi:hypothetical protein MMC26_006411 [Xylographa opegraphella]|nr:hypothetical protein [Xylographa opegraphella]
MDSLNLAGVIGTWAAVGLALIALIGIVGPLILLREKRSERHEALNAIDSQRTGYIRNGLKLSSEGRFFLKVKAPLLMEPPNPKDHFCETHLFEKSDNFRRSFEISKTGWVNLAAIIEMYSSGVREGDNLVLRQRQSWLPVHRFWILAIGLLGRYCKRDDHGKAIANDNASRLLIEEDEDKSDAWDSSPSSMKLYGITGTIWWRCKLDESEMSIDEVYFIPHSKADSEELYPDPIPLWQLSWLALGCLPLGPLVDDRVYDLSSFQPNYNSGGRNGESPEGKFYSFKPREFVAQTGHHKKWAQAMGLDMKNLYCIQLETSDFDRVAAATEANGNQGPWFRMPGTDGSYVKRSDIHRQILGLLHLPISPKGAVFDHDRYNGPSIFEVSAQNVSKLLESIHQVRYLGTLSDTEKGILAEMKHLWICNERRYREHEQPRFSRKEAQASYKFDIALRERLPSIPSHIIDIVGIIALMNETFFESLVSESTETLFLEVDVTANCVRTSSITGTIEHTVDFSEAFTSNPPETWIVENRYDNSTAILLAAIAACVRAFCFRSLWDSRKLVRLIQKTEDIVFVAASSRIPSLPVSQPPEVNNNRRRGVDFFDMNGQGRAFFGMNGQESPPQRRTVHRRTVRILPDFSDMSSTPEPEPFVGRPDPREDNSDSFTPEIESPRLYDPQPDDTYQQPERYDNRSLQSRSQRSASSPPPLIPGSIEAIEMEERQESQRLEPPSRRHLPQRPIADHDALESYDGGQSSTPINTLSDPPGEATVKSVNDTIKARSRTPEPYATPNSGG